MQFRAGISHSQKKKWHRFYPWWPRRCSDNTYRSFEWIERKGTFVFAGPTTCGWFWEYRAIK